MSKQRTAADSVPNPSDIAKGFSVGDTVIPIGQPVGGSGKVTRLYEGIGMADVEFNGGNRRMPVEELTRVDPDDFGYAPNTNTTPGGTVDLEPFGTRTIQTLPPFEAFEISGLREKVARKWVKTSLYWAARDRKYKATRTECGSGYMCPKCPDTKMKKAIYKRLDSLSERLWGCPTCMFLIKNSDILRYGEE